MGFKRNASDKFDVFHLKEDWFCFQYQLTVNGQLQPTKVFLAQMGTVHWDTLLAMLAKLLEYRNNGMSFDDQSGDGDRIISYFRTAVSRDVCIQLAAHELLPPRALRDAMYGEDARHMLPQLLDSPLEIPTTYP